MQKSDRRFRGYDEAPVLRYDNRWSCSFSRTQNDQPITSAARRVLYNTPASHLRRSPFVLTLTHGYFVSLTHPPPHTSDTTDYADWLPWKRFRVQFSFHGMKLETLHYYPPHNSLFTPTMNICLPIRLKFRQITYISFALNLRAFYITAHLSHTHRLRINYSCLFRDIGKLCKKYKVGYASNAWKMC